MNINDINKLTKDIDGEIEFIIKDDSNQFYDCSIELKWIAEGGKLYLVVSKELEG